MEGTHLTLTAVQERGWTLTMVADLLGEPDRLKRNPRYRNAAPMRLYASGRVQRIEQTPEWRERFEKAQQRRKGAAKAIETKARALLREVVAVTFSVPVMPLGRLLELSLQAWRSHQYDLGHYDADGNDAPNEVRFRWARNYLRHEMTAYDDHLASLWGRVGRGEAYDLLRAKVDETIDAAYPALLRAA